MADGMMRRNCHARKPYRCDGRQYGDCLLIIAIGDWYQHSDLPPNTEMGNVGWWHARLCVKCAAYYGHPIEEAAATTKPCRRCGVVKSLDEYWKSNQTWDGYRGICKQCFSVARRGKHPVAGPEVGQLYRSRNPQRYLQQRRRWDRDNPEKVQAQRALRNAVSGGRLVKAKACERCGKTGLLHGHHSDYARPFDVLWVCPKCHKEVHREQADAAVA